MCVKFSLEDYSPLTLQAPKKLKSVINVSIVAEALKDGEISAHEKIVLAEALRFSLSKDWFSDTDIL